MKCDETRIFRDIEVPADKLPGYRIVKIDCCGEDMYLYVLLPDGTFEGSRPCVLQFHGFPGFVKNQDLAQALRRIGCVVVLPFHRGAWGSGGTYSFTHLIEDAHVVANWVRSPEIVSEYKIDVERIILAGHSMGCHTALNAVKKMPWVRALVLMAPYDLSYAFRTDRREELINLLKAGSILKVDSETALLTDATQHQAEYAFETAFDAVKDKPLLLIGGSEDTLAPAADMIDPLWQKLCDHGTTAEQKYFLYPTTHGLDSHRNTVIREVCHFVSECV